MELGGDYNNVRVVVLVGLVSFVSKVKVFWGWVLRKGCR